MSPEVSDTMEMMRSISSTVSTVCNGGLLAREFFCVESFFGEKFIFLDVLVFGRGSLGVFMSPCSFFYSSPLSSSWSTSSPPPPPGGFGVVSSDVLCISCTSSFFLLLFPGPSYSSWVTTGLLMRSGLESYVCLNGTRNFIGHSLVISSISSSVSLQ
jgi:hypothetical protein